MRKILRNRIFIGLLIIIVIIIAGAVYLQATKKPAYEFVLAKRADISQVVSSTGHAQPTENVDLAFEKTGKVSSINIKVGDIVKQGDRLVSLENADLFAQVIQARANLDAEQQNLTELKNGTRPEELQIARSALDSAQNQAIADLQSVHNAAIAAMQKAVSTAKSSLLTLSDIQYTYFNSASQNATNIIDTKEAAIFALFGVHNAGGWLSSPISNLSSGLYARAQNISGVNVEATVVDILVALDRVKTALNTVPISDSISSTDKTSLSAEKSNINTEMVNVAAKQQAILVQKATNESAIASAQNELALKEAGATSEQIAVQEARVQASKANVNNIVAQYNKTIIYSPIPGLITKQEAKIGEIVAANSVVVSVISQSAFEIESNIPEADIAKIQPGQLSRITLDAYGSDVFFDGKVASIDPAETVIEGVATYKTKIQFNQMDERIKSGMTANIDILTAKKENVLVVPQKAVFKKNGEQFILLLNEQNQSEEKKVETGLRGSDGNIEIISGLLEGEKVLTAQPG